jgi:hypothetical protein
MRKSKMSRVDVATGAQMPLDFDPTSIRTLCEPRLGSVHAGVQPGVLPSRPRISKIQVANAVTRTRSVCTSYAKPNLVLWKRDG